MLFPNHNVQPFLDSNVKEKEKIEINQFFIQLTFVNPVSRTEKKLEKISRNFF
jgi:hypothetical protein